MSEYRKTTRLSAHPNAVTHLNNGVYITFIRSNNKLCSNDKYVLTVYSDSDNYKKHRASEIKYMNIDQINSYLQEEMLIYNF